MLRAPTTPSISWPLHRNNHMTKPAMLANTGYWMLPLPYALNAIADTDIAARALKRMYAPNAAEWLACTQEGAISQTLQVLAAKGDHHSTRNANTSFCSHL